LWIRGVALSCCEALRRAYEWLWSRGFSAIAVSSDTPTSLSRAHAGPHWHQSGRKHLTDGVGAVDATLSARPTADVGNAMLAAEQPHAVLLRRQLGAAAALPTAASRSNSPYMGPIAAGNTPISAGGNGAGRFGGASGSATQQQPPVMEALQLPGPAAATTAAASLMTAPPLFKRVPLTCDPAAASASCSHSHSHASSLAAADQHCAQLADEASTPRPAQPAAAAILEGEDQQRHEGLAAVEDDEDTDGRAWQHALVACPWLFKPCPDCCRTHSGREVSVWVASLAGLVGAARGSRTCGS